MAPPAKDKIKDLHNRNCYEYLKYMSKDAPGWLRRLPIVGLQHFWKTPDYQYDPTVSYANLYNRFLSALEEQIDVKPEVATNTHLVHYANTEEKKRELNKWLARVYENNNSILETTYEHFADELKSRRLIDSRPEGLISDAVKPIERQASHDHTPQYAGSMIGRASAFLSSNFKPMLTTSIPSTRDYKYTIAQRADVDRSYPQELRFGTQGQRHDDQPRVSPLFKHWLKQKAVVAEPDKISHVYFNLLGWDRDDSEGKKEKELSQALHDLEAEHPNIVVITLPADKGIMDKHAYQKTETTATLTVGSVYEDFLKRATGERAGNGTKDPVDFYISNKAKLLLYANDLAPEAREALSDDELKARETAKLQELLDSSFKAMGIKPDAKLETLSPAQQQAVWFHFTKYTFPNMVLDTIKPVSWNASCKDAIDRGGVASAYVNLMRSIDSGIPMSRDEFDMALHAAAAVVKGRGLNHHYELVWNAIDAYVDANIETLSADKDSAWLIHWRNDNMPHARVNQTDTFAKVFKQNTQLLDSKKVSLGDQRDLLQASLAELNIELGTPLSDADKGVKLVQKAAQEAKIERIGLRLDLIKQAKQILEAASKHSKTSADTDVIGATSGQRILLEIASQCTQMALDPTTPPSKDLGKVVEKLNSNPALGKIRGYLKVFFGNFLALFGSSYGADLAQKGERTLARYNEDDVKAEHRTQMAESLEQIKGHMTKLEGSHLDETLVYPRGYDADDPDEEESVGLRM